MRVKRLIRSYNQDNSVDKVWDDLMELGGEAFHSKLLRKTRLNSRDFKEAVETLIEAERLRRDNETVEREGTGEIKKSKYVALNPDEKLELPSVEVPEYRSISEEIGEISEEDLEYLREDWEPEDASESVSLDRETLLSVMKEKEGPEPLDAIASRVEFTKDEVESLLEALSESGDVYQPEEDKWDTPQG